MLASSRGGAPTLMIGLPRLPAVGRRPDCHAHFQLVVTLDRRFPRAASFLAPGKRELGTPLGVLLLDEAERQHLAFVEAVAAEHRRTDNRSAAHHCVE